MIDMKLENTRRSAVPLLGGMAMELIGVLANGSLAEVAAICRPGDDWVDSCTTGVDAFPSSIASQKNRVEV